MKASGLSARGLAVREWVRHTYSGSLDWTYKPGARRRAGLYAAQKHLAGMAALLLDGGSLHSAQKYAAAYRELTSVIIGGRSTP